MNVDIGGGTSKISVCAEGKVIALTAIDVGARLVCVDANGKINRIEEAGRRFGAALGLDLKLGDAFPPETARELASHMADRLFEAMKGASPAEGGTHLLRLDPLAYRGKVDEVTFSGGVSEFIYGREKNTFGDLGPLLAEEIRKRVEPWVSRIETPGPGHPRHRGRRLAIHDAGQRQHDLRRAAGDGAAAQRAGDRAEAAAGRRDRPQGGRRRSITAALKQLDLGHGKTPVAVFVPWRGSATFQRLDAFCKGVVAGTGSGAAGGHPLVLAGDGDVGGLLGIHLREEMHLPSPVVSIDGLELKDFDFIDIGAMMESSGAVAVVIKSLVFPTTAGVGQDWRAERLSGKRRPPDPGSKGRPASQRSQNVSVC